LGSLEPRAKPFRPSHADAPGNLLNAVAVDLTEFSPEVASERRPRRPVDASRLARVASEHLDFVWRCLRRLGVPAADADDAAQHVFWVASSKLGEVPIDKERAFLFATASRVAANVRRSIRRQRNAYGSLAMLPSEPVENQEQVADQLRARALLDRVIQSMPEELREVLVLFEIEELSVAEIAETLSIPTGTVGSRLRRARIAFREAVARYKAQMQFRTATSRR